MTRLGLLFVVAALAAGCVSSDDASSGAVRVLHAVPDAPRMNLYVDDQLQASGIDYRGGTAYYAVIAGQHQVQIDERLPSTALLSTRTVFDAALGLSANDEVTFIVTGQAESAQEEVLSITTTTRGVPTGKNRLQVVHAAPGSPPVDVYVVAPDAVIAASTPFVSGLAYKAWTPQSEVTGGEARIVITTAGDPADVLLDSGSVFLTLEGTWLVSVLRNTGLDAADHPVTLVLLTGSGGGVIQDKDTPASFRVVNASPGSYALDAFLNATSADDTARQVCDPLTSEEGTVLEKCALAYETVGAFDLLDPGSYDFKVQQSDPATLTAKAFPGTFVAGAELTTLVTGLVADTATATDVSLQTLTRTRRIATGGQLRLVDVSLAASAALEGDPTTDRLEIYVTEACADLTDESADYTGLVFGSDTGYVSYADRDYQVTLTRTDTAAGAAAPEVLLSKRVSLAASGIYTLLIGDAVGGVQPLKFISVDDDPAFADCPAPP